MVYRRVYDAQPLQHLQPFISLDKFDLVSAVLLCHRRDRMVCEINNVGLEFLSDEANFTFLLDTEQGFLSQAPGGVLIARQDFA